MQFSKLSRLFSNQVYTIYHLPFIQELASNQLPIEKFHYYLRQDTFYLEIYAQILEIIAAKLKNKSHQDLLNEFAFNTINEENILHNEFLEASRSDVLHPKSAVCDAYCRHLLCHALKSDPVIAVAAVLPCFWVYREVGQYVNAIAAQPNRYMSWINIYCSKDFCASVNSMISVLNELSLGIDDEIYYKVKTAFADSVCLENEFWEDAYSFCVVDADQQ